MPSGTMECSFFDLFQEHILRLKQNGSLRTAETYIAAYKKLRSFCNGKDLTPGDITPELMESFQTWLRSQHLSMNTTSFHIRKIRALYNKAVEQGLTADLHPFRHVYTGIAKTSKRAITINDLKRIKELQLDDPMLEYARDMFLFSFYTRGMAFVDMSYLRKSDVDGGLLTYRRKKTGQQLTIRWEHSMKEIVERYPSKSGYYLLPIIQRQGAQSVPPCADTYQRVAEDSRRDGEDKP